MHPGYMSGWGWFAASLTMVVWLIVIGLVIYAAVRLAQGNRRDKTS
jgi:hypothetical protein